MLRRTTTTKTDEARLPILVARAALEHQRPLSGDLTNETRKLLREARHREKRFQRRAPAAPMS
jgi:hypothetical protein